MNYRLLSNKHSNAHILSKRQLLCSVGAICLVLCISSWISLFLPFPELDAFMQRDWSTRIYDRGGNLIQILALGDGIRREFTAYEAIPPDAVRIFLAAEDKDFFSHRGIDIAAIARAAYQNISSGKRVSGASTITMQLARLIVPAKERTFFAKLREARNALRIERRLSKQAILELYLNSIPFGFQTEGLTSAARNFFALPLSELTTEQLCCLAVIPRRPTGYNPLEHPEACAEKATALYRSVFIQGNETQNGRQGTQLEGRLLQTARTARRFEYPFGMPHYIEYLVRRYKAGDLQRINQTQEIRRPVSEILETTPRSLPPDWYLTADNTLSAQAEFLLQVQLKNNPQARVRNGAVLVIENATGNILAWVGSNSYFDDENNGKIDGVTALNQSGSSSKPFLYALALEHGWKPSDVLPDIPMRFGKEEAYIPRNFNNRFNGPVRLRIALASSLNIPAVYLLNELGTENYLHTLEALGFQSIDTAGAEAGLSLALGSMPVSLYELVRAFSVFPRDGILIPLHSFTDGSTADGFSEPKQVFNADTARLICSILSDSAARAKGFGFSSTFKTPFPSIFKTGTANQFQSLIALASSSAFTVGVWMGNFAGNTVIGKTGSSAPAAIAHNLLIRLHRQPLADGTAVPAKNFMEPEHWYRGSVCALSGMPAGSACHNTVQEYLPAFAVFNKYDRQNEHNAGHNNYQFDTSDRYGTYKQENGECEQEGNECTWHRTQNGHTITVYPEKYRRWFANIMRHGTIGQLNNALTIIRPADGSHFFSDHRYLRTGVPIEIIGGAEDTIQAIYDDHAPITLNRPFLGALPLEKGDHRLLIRCGDEEVAAVFTVE
ncbi:penicillin-binding protein 1C [Treponema vincentii]|uniref:peptidoglycan glycosyltransferase n=2 Tax=Treponema vincentii TaxID=69710 RepID=A0A6P1Y2A0_9SPIR|nr:penicillin-binding protein 1C [Treponema vincentii]